MILDSKLNFKCHLSEKISKANKGIGIIKRLYNFLPRATPVNIYKTFVRPNLDYGDVIYDNCSNETFCKMIESVQYNAALSITGAIRGSSREKLYQELGFESLRDRRWYRKLCFYCKILHNDCRLYLNECIPIFEPSTYSLRSNHPLIRIEQIKSTFSPHPLLVGCNLTQTFKIQPPLKFLSEHYLNLFALGQHQYTRSTIHEDENY